ncbi:MAG: DUF6036 family nucleotidyltransferase [Pseudobdellovibrio sp.]|nr:DUF6036 family nucleotidyltransferase [Pseudobdellovibrio sp.]
MKDIIVEFDKFLIQNNLKFEAVIIGGAALNILDITNRKTKDVDCLDPELPSEIKKASEEFAKKRLDLGLDIDWLNNGPQTLKTDLPKGWRIRTQLLYRGNAINLDVLGRSDLLKSKLFAYCDRTAPDFEDLKSLKPTVQELNESIDWVKDRDAHIKWPDHVEKAFTVLKKALGYES